MTVLSERCRLQHYEYHVESMGAKTLPPLMFLHGFMGSGRDFTEIMTALSHAFYCIAVDLPGHGQTHVCGDDQCYTMEAIALSVTQILDQWKLGPCHLLGYSMGGRLALYLGLNYPQYFRSLIVESASPGLANPTERRDRRQRDHAIAQRIEQENFESFLHWWYGQPLFDTLRRHPTYDAMLQRRRRNTPEKLAKSLKYMGLGQQPSLWSELSTSSHPMQFIVGTKDLKFVSLAQKMASITAKADLCLIKHCGHSVHQEQPIAYGSMVHQFLQEKIQ